MAKKVQNMLIEVPTDNSDVNAIKDFIKTSSNQLDPAPQEDGIEKKSEVFMRFVQPGLHRFQYEDEIRYLCYLAILGWNLALTPRRIAIQVLAKGLQRIPMEERLEYKKSVEFWIDRKEKIFGEYGWNIADFELKYSTKGVAITVKTTNHLEYM